jgi:hypothetical protein
VLIVRRGWTPIEGDDLDRWNSVLLGTDAHLYQYPYWNEPLRYIHFTPDYLIYTDGREPLAYLCVLRTGVPRLRMGIVRGGPVALKGELPHAASKALLEWAKAAGYVFIRFSHESGDVLEKVGTHGSVDHRDPLPFYPPPEQELIVEQLADDDETAARFQAVARRNIRSAREAAYVIEESDSPGSLEHARPIFAALSGRKGQVFSRPFASYVELVRLAARHRAARLYTASLDGTPLQAALVVRDRNTAHYVIGALDVEKLGNRPSPGCLLHWQAMRAFHRAGAQFYNLGSWGSGGLRIFKSKFRPLERRHPPPLTLVVQPSMYRLWTGTMPLLRNSRPRVEQLMTAVRDLRRRVAL